MPEIFPPPPIEDSPDFTDAEANAAEETSDPRQLAARITQLLCHTCKDGLEATGYTHRRRAGVHYSRVRLICKNGHSETRVFRLDWLKGDGTT